jgi:voltage-gated potassium channel
MRYHQTFSAGRAGKFMIFTELYNTSVNYPKADDLTSRNFNDFRLNYKVMKNKKLKRYRTIVKINRLTEIPLIILGFGWLLLLIIELIWQLTPVLRQVVTAIWIIFIVDFIIKLIITPERWQFLAKNTLTIISLFIPAFRIFRIFASLRLLRSLGFIRSVRVVRVVGSVNRGMRVLGKTLERRAFGYVFILTLLIAFTGAAAMYAFEEPGAFANYMDALYWTAMRLTTIASDYWPQTPEGKTIGFLLSVYSLGVLGYFTATLASFFLGQDADSRKGEIAGAKQLEEMIREVRLLKEALSQSPGEKSQ